MTKILTVDDSRVARMLVKRAVSELRPDWQVVEAAEADSALKLLKGDPVDIAFIDVNMPGMNGIELSGLLRKTYPDLLMFLVTANIQTSVQEHAAELGIEVLGKPVTTEKLSGLLEAANV